MRKSLLAAAFAAAILPAASIAADAAGPVTFTRLPVTAFKPIIRLSCEVIGGASTAPRIRVTRRSGTILPPRATIDVTVRTRSGTRHHIQIRHRLKQSITVRGPQGARHCSARAAA